ncbi:MAG: chromosomal replication initiator protein DnaA [Deltaproteobacteria bacterium]|nr:chromosomal replication initiator protein DnaA [Deltaproteobacteria bacterium]
MSQGLSALEVRASNGVNAEIAGELSLKLLDSLKTKVSEFNFNNWFKNAQWVVNGPGEVALLVPSKFVRDWILENYLEVIKFELFKITGAECNVSVRIDSSIPSRSNGPSLPVGSVPSPATPVRGMPQAPTHEIPASLNSRYVFDNFVVGDSNQFVHAACRAVANNPAKNYNPLFIYGGVGLGKTHLVNAIGIEVLRKNPACKIIYATGEKFTNEVINSIRYNKTFELRQKYRNNCDLLLIDDVQFIAGKEKTMEEFFHTFNALYELRKQIVMTSDTLPKDIPNLEERLRSRFGWGLLADIQAPELETRAAILRKKAEDEGIALSDEVCQFIASHVKTNVRDLEGCLVRVSAFASMAKIPITVGLAREVLKNILRGFSTVPSIEAIQHTVADYFKLQIVDLKSHRRHRNLAVPRQIAMYLCKKYSKASYPEIGNKFGGKDHTTVIHAFQKISRSVTDDSSLRDRVDALEKIIAGHA